MQSRLMLSRQFKIEQFKMRLSAQFLIQNSKLLIHNRVSNPIVFYFLTMLGVLSMGFIVPSALYSSFFITTLRLYEWPSCSEPSWVK